MTHGAGGAHVIALIPANSRHYCGEQWAQKSAIGAKNDTVLEKWSYPHDCI